MHDNVYTVVVHDKIIRSVLMTKMLVVLVTRFCLTRDIELHQTKVAQGQALIGRPPESNATHSSYS